MLWSLIFRVQPWPTYRLHALSNDLDTFSYLQCRYLATLGCRHQSANIGPPHLHLHLQVHLVTPRGEQQLLSQADIVAVVTLPPEQLMWIVCIAHIDFASVVNSSPKKPSTLISCMRIPSRDLIRMPIIALRRRDGSTRYQLKGEVSYRTTSEAIISPWRQSADMEKYKKVVRGRLGTWKKRVHCQQSDSAPRS
jgi:hypothetical protein